MKKLSLSPNMTPRTTPERVTMRRRLSRIHFLVSAVILRGPCEAETSWPSILANRYSEKREDALSSISCTASRAETDPADPVSPSREAPRRTAGPRQHHDDEGWPFWGCCRKSPRKDQFLSPSSRRRRSRRACRKPSDSIVVPAY